MANGATEKLELLQGTLDMMVLRMLSAGPANGYEIARAIERLSDDVLAVDHGSLYPALQRLELYGWIEGVWGVTPSNRRARIYKISAAGRKQLVIETRKYAKLTLAIARVMEAE